MLGGHLVLVIVSLGIATELNTKTGVENVHISTLNFGNDFPVNVW